jgi:hypothetical protein
MRTDNAGVNFPPPFHIGNCRGQDEIKEPEMMIKIIQDVLDSIAIL